MVTRILLLLVGLVMAAMAGVFLLYVSVLSLLASIAVGIGLIATLALGYWAGTNSSDERAAFTAQPNTIPVITAPRKKLAN
ncbi:MAG TPA: hypothetical protein VGJ09_08150 [Bryobacteraceae bacterium]|jgi:hypothetical protein